MRRKAAPKRKLLPDPKYGSDRLAKFINHLMERGRRSLAEKIAYTALETADQRLDNKMLEGENNNDGSGDDKGGHGGNQIDKPLQIFNLALTNVAPNVEVKSRRIGGATYQVPIAVNLQRGISLAMRWIIAAAKGRGEKSMALRLAAEIVDACHQKGMAMKKRDDMHRMAKANQAFAHYRW